MVSSLFETRIAKVQHYGFSFRVDCLFASFTKKRNLKHCRKTVERKEFIPCNSYINYELKIYLCKTRQFPNTISKLSRICQTLLSHTHPLFHISLSRAIDIKIGLPPSPFPNSENEKFVVCGCQRWANLWSTACRWFLIMCRCVSKDIWCDIEVKSGMEAAEKNRTLRFYI